MRRNKLDSERIVGYTEVIPKTAILESSYLKPVEPAEAGCPKSFPPRWSQIADSMGARFMEIAARKQTFLGTSPVTHKSGPIVLKVGIGASIHLFIYSQVVADILQENLV